MSEVAIVEVGMIKALKMVPEIQIWSHYMPAIKQRSLR